MQLLASGSATIDSGGRAELEVGPAAAGVFWDVSRMVVSATEGDPQAVVYLGPEDPGNIVDAADSARLAVSDSSSLLVQAGARLLCVFTEGDPGSLVSWVLYGSEEAS